MPSTAIHLVIATPGIGGTLDRNHMRSATALFAYCNAHGIGFSAELITHDPIAARARNTLAAKFLDRPHASHMLFAGPDVGFPVSQVLRLLSCNAEVAAAYVPQTDDMPPAERLCMPERRRGDFLAAECVGLDLMLMRRSVFTRLFTAYPQLRYMGETGADPAFRSVHQYALFDSYIDPDTREYICGAEAFCRRWRNIGGELWLDGNSRTLRAAPYDLAGIARDFSAHLSTAP